MLNQLIHHIRNYRAFLALKKQYKINQQLNQEKQRQQEEFYSR